MATNRRMERSTKEMHKFLAEHTTEDMTMDEINALLQEHLGEINAGIDRRRTEETAETADDYMDMAEDRLAEGNEQEALRLARKALKLEPDNLDAEWFLIQREVKAPEDLLRRVELALERGKASLEKQGFFDDSVGEFWQLLETRPYMRLRDQYVVMLRDTGRLRMAAREAEDMIRLNTNDNLGERFTLMHLYAALEEAEPAEALLKKFSEHDEGAVLLPLTLLYYKLGNMDKAEKTLRRLTKVNKETRTFIRDMESGQYERKISKIREQGGYAPFTEEELIMMYDENEDVYDGAPLFFRWMAKTLKM